jgi:hypothetical protein
MTPAEFVECFVREKDALVRSYMRDRDTDVATKIARLGLPPAKAKILQDVIDAVLTDAFYTVLLALDGEASLGGIQATYSLRDESGNELTNGELEGPAWDQFHGPKAGGGLHGKSSHAQRGKRRGRPTRSIWTPPVKRKE